VPSASQKSGGILTETLDCDLRMPDSSRDPAMAKQLRPVYRFLGYDKRIAAYLTAIERNARLLRAIRTALPSPLDEHCLHASLESGELSLVTDSPVWASRLRFFTPQLERDLDSRHGSISECRVRVQPCTVAPSPAPVRKLSSRAARHLMEAAEGIDDAPLAAALRRLAKAGSGDR
jgi:hypothetical protein